MKIGMPDGSKRLLMLLIALAVVGLVAFVLFLIKVIYSLSQNIVIK
jgi:hypothetical protein